MEFATAAGHWYRADGSPQYTIVGANGKERQTTLRDARKLGLLPSVTGIIRMAAAPGLEKWKRDQVLMAALTLPKIDGESSDAFLARVDRDWQAQGRAAADRGTQIHAAIEQHYRGQPPSEEFWDWVKVAKKCIDERCGTQEWSAERSFASSLGYGGKTDLHSPEWVIDVKTKDGPEGKLYDEHIMQLAAYRDGLRIPNARCGILFVDRNAPSALLIEAVADELMKASTMFYALLTFWQAKNGYWPCNSTAAQPAVVA